MGMVSVRELKNRLSHYLRIVEQGESILITARGKPVARLLPAYPGKEQFLPPELEERLWELVARGVIAWSGLPFRMPEPVAVNRGPQLVSDLVVEDRE